MPQLRAMQETVDKRFPGRINLLSCRRCLQEDAVVLVYSYADTDPGSYHVWRPGKNEWDPVGNKRQGIDPRRMAQVDFHRIKARDGRDLPLWLTVPRGVKPSPGDASKAAPAVVLVHGGPWVRGGHWRWQAKEQFLASRGYVVIAPEFRGSRGFGTSHYRAG